MILKCAMERQTVSSKIKPFRNGTRLTTIDYNFRKPWHDFWIHDRFFYKFGGSAKYRQWMFGYDENICGYYDGTAKPGLFYAITKGVFERISPKTLHAGPYTGVEGIIRIDIDDLVSNTIPQVILTGDYRIVIRFHTTTIKTFFMVTIGGHIDALKPLEAMPMGRR